MFVIVKKDSAHAIPFFVAPPGQEKSYTDKLQHARTFKTKERAQQELCPDNERIVHIGEILLKPE